MAQPQTFKISLGGTFYQLTMHWCAPANCWILDIADQSGNKIVSGRPMVTGVDLLGQFRYLGIGGGGGMLVQSDNDPDLVPDFDSLGSTGHLFWVGPQAASS
jgi:hypothetical protein